DTAGWFTADAEDLRITLDALVGRRASQREPRGCYLALPGLDAAVATACAAAAARLAAPAEATVRGDLLNGFSGLLDAYNTTVALEAWEVHRGWAAAYRDRYDPAVWQRLNRVHSLTPAQLEAATFSVTTLRLLWTSFFQSYDFLVLPTTPCPALTKAECTLENRGRLIALTAPASLGGLPVLSLPVALPAGHTAGLQVVVNHPQSPAVSWALDRFRT
ncbi:MAG: amidase, partial [Planctomycetia bacterium]|nr:amidase [Planctomycetia bacterium]